MWRSRGWLKGGGPWFIRETPEYEWGVCGGARANPEDSMVVVSDSPKDYLATRAEHGCTMWEKRKQETVVIA